MAIMNSVTDEPSIEGEQMDSSAIPNAIRTDGDKIVMMDQERKVRREIANSNERRRMQSINAGFQSLRSLLPQDEDEKLSKAAILQHTAEYIYVLEQEKTRLLAQNCQLKRLLSQSQSQLDDRFQLSSVATTSATPSTMDVTSSEADVCLAENSVAPHQQRGLGTRIDIVPAANNTCPPTASLSTTSSLSSSSATVCTNISLPPIQVPAPQSATDLSLGTSNVVIGLSGPKKRRMVNASSVVIETQNSEPVADDLLVTDPPTTNSSSIQLAKSVATSAFDDGKSSETSSLLTSSLHKVPVSLVQQQQPHQGQPTLALKPRIIVTTNVSGVSNVEPVRSTDVADDVTTTAAFDDEVAYKLLAATSEPLPIAVVLRGSNESNSHLVEPTSQPVTVSSVKTVTHAVSRHNPLLSAAGGGGGGSTKRTFCVQSTSNSQAKAHSTAAPPATVVSPTDVVIHNRLSTVRVAVDSIISSLDPIPLIPTAIQTHQQQQSQMHQSQPPPPPPPTTTTTSTNDSICISGGSAIDLVCSNSSSGGGGVSTGDSACGSGASDLQPRIFDFLVDKVQDQSSMVAGAAAAAQASSAAQHSSTAVKLETESASASSAAKQNLNSIVEAIRHLEGDQMFLTSKAECSGAGGVVDESNAL